MSSKYPPYPCPNNKFIIINNSYNEGIIKARGNTGGLVARAYGDISINNSYNNAEIYNEKRTTSGVCIGGLIGLIMETSPNCVVINSYNNSNINIEELKDEAKEPTQEELISFFRAKVSSETKTRMMKV